MFSLAARHGNAINVTLLREPTIARVARDLGGLRIEVDIGELRTQIARRDTEARLAQLVEASSFAERRGSGIYFVPRAHVMVVEGQYRDELNAWAASYRAMAGLQEETIPGFVADEDVPEFQDPLFVAYRSDIMTVGLLRPEEEVRLGRSIELGEQLNALSAATRKAKCATCRLTSALLRRCAHFAPLCRELSRFLGWTREPTLSVVLLDPLLRSHIDGPVNPRLISSVAHAMDTDPEDAEDGIIEFSIASGLLPTSLMESLGSDPTLTELNPGSDNAVVKIPNCSSLAEHFLRVRAEASKARELMITANLRLVVSIALGYRDRGLDLLDLTQEGNLGLM